MGQQLGLKRTLFLSALLITASIHATAYGTPSTTGTPAAMSAGAAVPERVVSRLMAEPLVAVGARRAESEALKIALAGW